MGHPYTVHAVYDRIYAVFPYARFGPTLLICALPGTSLLSDTKAWATRLHTHTHTHTHTHSKLSCPDWAHTPPNQHAPYSPPPHLTHIKHANAQPRHTYTHTPQTHTHTPQTRATNALKQVQSLVLNPHTHTHTHSHTHTYTHRCGRGGLSSAAGRWQSRPSTRGQGDSGLVACAPPQQEAHSRRQ